MLIIRCRITSRVTQRVCSTHWLFLFVFVAASAWQTANAADTTISYTADIRITNNSVILDTRKMKDCLDATLPDARCLPASDFLGPHRRLANISGLLWRLGTAGLTGDEHVLVTGDTSTDKEFIAGLLYVAGQRQISLLTEPVESLASNATDSGIPRSTIREKVFQSRMRSDRVLLRSDIANIIHTRPAPRIIDGRSELEYLGQNRHAARGGHIPGAQHYPLDANSFAQTGTLTVNDKDAVAYSHDSYSGLVYLARLLASDVQARIYLEGWVGWASDGALPADNMTFPSRRTTAK